MPFNAPLHVVVSTSTVNNLTIEFVRQYNGFYYVRYLNSYSLFSVPSVQDVRVFDKAPPSFNSGQLKIRIIVPPTVPQQPPAQEQLLVHSTFDDFDNSFDGLLRQLFNNGN
ncbi:13795_t:CDS:2 [Gigaspora rosea]|nr:13795_t:CDS:2 [Gigaspora rosea]